MTDETTVEKSTVDQIMNMFDGDWAPEVIEDSEGLDFDKPIKGKYKCRITGLERRTGESGPNSKNPGNPYDFFSLKLQAQEDVEGDRSGNRYLDKTYFVGTSDYSDDPDLGIKRLFNDLHTAGVLEGVTVSSSDKYEVAESIGDQLIDKMVNVTAYASKSKKQVVKVVNEFKLKEKKEDKEEATW